MCGISGFVDYNKHIGYDDLLAMISSTNYRGPDDNGIEIFRESDYYVGLGHNRLSIIDLSDAGHQPMCFENVSIVFNGEIYNFNEIKAELSVLGHNFISNSDTEVILHAFKEWGDKCVEYFIGMFAFAILDYEARTLKLFRDRAGVKPIFYYWHDDIFLFASELKAFSAIKTFKKEINLDAINLYMDYGFVPTPYCIFRHCSKLCPGHILTLNLPTKKIDIKKYWDVVDYFRMPKLTISYEEAKIKLLKLLQSSFNYRMVSDVPVGIFLSGGFDSTAVAALLQNGRKEKVKTFTIGFEDGNNEAPFAKQISRFLGTEHNEYFCSVKEAQDIIPLLPFYYDEPFADSSAIPSILVSKISREQVTVSLSADGGDEIFAGYIYYKNFITIADALKKSPYALKYLLGFSFKLIRSLIPTSKISKKLSKYINALLVTNSESSFILHEDYFKLASNTRKKLFKNTKLNNCESIYAYKNPLIDDSLSLALAMDYKNYMQNDILTKIDRATMSVSLEGREPFLDHRIVEFVAQLPNEYKLGTSPKRILKDIVYSFVPKDLMDRPKVGFEIPVTKWLKGDLSYLIEEFMNDKAIIEAGFFNVKYVKDLKKRFFSNKLDDDSLIWKILQFQMWYRKWMK